MANTVYADATLRGKETAAKLFSFPHLARYIALSSISASYDTCVTALNAKKESLQV